MDCTVEGGVDKAVTEIDKILRGMGVKPRGEKEDQEKTKESGEGQEDVKNVKVTDGVALPTEAVFIDALHSVVQAEAEERERDKQPSHKGGAGVDVHTLRQIQLQHGVQNCADALKLASQLI